MPDLTSDQLGQLATNSQQIASGLLKYKLDNASTIPNPAFNELSEQINLIFQNSATLAALATIETEQEISGSLNSLKESTDKIDDALKKIQKVQDVIDIAATVINIGTSFLSKDIEGAVDNIGELAKKIGINIKGGE
jgi:methyl-accepting chemotaxis protein